MDSLIFFGLIAIAATILSIWGFPHILREFRLIWFARQVNGTVLQVEIKPLKLGYRLIYSFKIETESGEIISNEVAPGFMDYHISRHGAEQVALQIPSGTQVKAYYDPKPHRAYLTARYYDLIDKVFSPFFLVMTPCLGLIFPVLFIFIWIYAKK